MGGGTGLDELTKCYPPETLALQPTFLVYKLMASMIPDAFFDGLTKNNIKLTFSAINEVKFKSQFLSHASHTSHIL